MKHDRSYGTNHSAPGYSPHHFLFLLSPFIPISVRPFMPFTHAVVSLHAYKTSIHTVHYPNAYLVSTTVMSIIKRKLITRINTCPCFQRTITEVHTRVSQVSHSTVYDVR